MPLSTAVSGEQKLALEIEGISSNVIAAIKKIPAVIRVSNYHDVREGVAKYVVEYDKNADIRRDVFNAMSRIGCPILDMQSGNETLEDMFLKLTAADQTNGSRKGGVK